MRTGDLVKYGIPPTVVKSWAKNQGELLLPVQVQAVKNHKILEGKSLVICAPTSSGKTFCGELAAVVNLFGQKKVVYLVALKAIAEEKFSDFARKYSDLGIKVIISTRDRREFDRDLEKGNFDLAVVIYEKFNQLLIRNLDVLCMISLIVVDELQMIGDSSRGHTLELALTKIVNSKYRPQIIGLSAVLGDADTLSSWLGSGLLFEKSRPVELLQGILLDGRFIYRKHNSQEEGEERLVDLTSDQPEEVLFSNLEKLVQDGDQILVFLKSKFESELAAQLFAERVRLPPAAGAIEELNELESTTLKEKLTFCLSSGVGFHNADLSFDERRIIENFYFAGEIRLIFSTTTLAMGVNLPAKTVFVEAQKYTTGSYSEKGIPTPISWAEYENMSGRAGRFKLQEDFGRSIMLASDRFHFDSLWEEYVEGKEESLLPSLRYIHAEDIVLDFVASGLARDVSQLERLITSTLSHKLGFESGDSVEGIVKRLVDSRILIRKEDQSFFASELGGAVAAKGITIQTTEAVVKKLDKNEDSDQLSWFYDLLDTDDGKRIHVSLSFAEVQQKVYEKELRKRDRQKTPANQRIRSLLESELSLTPDQQRQVKLSLLFSDWISPLSTLELEKKYRLRSGYINQAAQSIAWLMDSASSLARVLNKHNSLVSFLKHLSLRVQFGVNRQGTRLAQLRIPGMGRDLIWRLVQANLYSFDKLKRARLKDLHKVMPETQAKRIKDFFRHKAKSGRLYGKEKSPSQIIRRTIPRLLIDGAPVKDKFAIFLDGRKVDLPGKSFGYLFKLAWAVFEREGGWLHKLDLETGENQPKYIYRLRKDLRVLTGSKQELIENNRLGFYRLAIPREKIEFNIKSLSLHPDAEIKGALVECSKVAQTAISGDKVQPKAKKEVRSSA